MHRNESIVKDADRAFVTRILLVSVISVLFGLLIHLTFIAASKPDWSLAEILVEGFLTAVIASMIIYGLYRHLLDRKMLLRVTENGIVIGPREELIGFDSIEHVEFRRGLVRIVGKWRAGSPKLHLIRSEYIWNIEEFMATLERLCNMRDLRHP